VHDDRAEFAAAQREFAMTLAADADLVHRAFEVQVDAAKHRFTYLWNWLGVPIIQLPSDIVVLQEIIWETKPTIIIETGVARGGSVVFSASMLQLLGEGRVIGIDIDIRAHNRKTIENHPLSHRIRLVEGSSVDPEVVTAVKALVPPGSQVMVILDSLHTHEHVLAELRAYSPLVSPGQFLVVADTGVGIKEAERLHFDRWDASNNPLTAMKAFLTECDRFEQDPFYNAKLLMTSSPGGYLRCTKPAHA
jgi:cephalosporin hydroxylase